MLALRFSALVTTCLIGSALVGCDSTPATSDAGTADAHVLLPSALFGPCEQDSQCPGEGAVCRHDEEGYPEGYCTIPCDDRTPCDAFGSYHHCVQRTGEDRNYCEQRCLNGMDCGRTGYTCIGEVPPSGGLCIGVCADDTDCSGGYECERYSGICYPIGTAPTAGAIAGAACESSTDCRSAYCIGSTDADGNPTGFVDGSCSANCILPTGWNSNTLYSGTSFPQGTCADDGICFPAAGSYSEGDRGVCFDGCAADGDCRPGYQCQKTFGTASGAPATFDNGVCQPIDCSMVDCPAGYACQQLMYTDGSVRNLCAP